MQVYDEARQLALTIRKSEEYTEYIRLKEIAEENKTASALMTEYRRMQTSLQVKALSGIPADASETLRFQQLSSLLFASGDTAACLLAEMRLQKMMGDIFRILTEASGLPTDLSL